MLSEKININTILLVIYQNIFSDNIGLSELGHCFQNGNKEVAVSSAIFTVPTAFPLSLKYLLANSGVTSA